MSVTQFILLSGALAPATDGLGNPSGDYVRVADYNALERENAALREAARRYVEHMRPYMEDDECLECAHMLALLEPISESSQGSGEHEPVRASDGDRLEGRP